MTLLHTWALMIAAAALALPVAIHLLTRPRPRRLALSTIHFVREAVSQRRARHRLRDVLVLCLRTLAVLLLGLAFARPIWGERPLVDPAEARQGVRVVVLDCSQSMAAQNGGAAAFERGRVLAARHLADAPGRRANLLLAAARTRAVFERPAASASGLVEELDRARALPQRLNVAAALTAAGEMFLRTPVEPGQRRELVVVSDFQRANWVAADFAALPADVVIQFESVAPPERVPNLAILRAGLRGCLERGRDVKLFAEVANFSDTPRQVEVDITVGPSTHRVSGLCPPDGKVTLNADARLEVSGFVEGEARLLGVADGLAEDNIRHFVLEARAAPTYGLVTRQSAAPTSSSSHFLERALAPFALRDAGKGERVVRISPEELDRQSAAAADLLVIDHPGKLSEESARLIAGLMRRGKPALYVAAEPGDAVNLRRLTDAAGADMKMPVEFLPPTTPGIAPGAGSTRFIAEMRSGEAPFNVFGDGLAQTVGSLRFGPSLATGRREGGLADDVLASYSDRSAFLTISACGSGTLAVLNVDLASSNLPSSPLFVPLIGELAGRLLEQRRSAETAECGEPVAAYLPPEATGAAGLNIVGPGQHADGPATMPVTGPTRDADGVAALGELAEDRHWTIWRWPAAGAPGVYQVKRGQQTVFALATELSAEESDLRPLDPAVLKHRLAGGRTIHFQSLAGAARQEADPLWTRLALACVVCLLAELLVLKAFRT